MGSRHAGGFSPFRSLIFACCVSSKRGVVHQAFFLRFASRKIECAWRVVWICNKLGFDFSWMNRNSLCHAKGLLDWLCGWARRIAESMRCRICVIISQQLYQVRSDIRWGRRKKFEDGLFINSPIRGDKSRPAARLKTGALALIGTGEQKSEPQNPAFSKKQCL